MTIVEEDFWKDIFVHMQHKNMMRQNASRLYLSDCEYEFNRFAVAHPEVKTELTDAETFKTWEFYITPQLKMRFFIQNQIKASIMEKQGNEFQKVCDAKFVNNPFPEIEEFLQHLDSYLVEIERNKEDDARYKMQQRIAYQFIKAYIQQKLSNKEIIWTLETLNKDFKLTLEPYKNQKDNKKGDVKEFNITLANYKQEIDSIDYSALTE